MNEYEKLVNKNDVFIINVLKQKANYTKEKFDAAQKIFDERGLNMESSDEKLLERKEAYLVLEAMMLEGKPLDEIKKSLVDHGVEYAQTGKLIHSNYKSLSVKLKEEHIGGNIYYLYAIVWVIGFSIILIALLQRFFGPGVLMGNFLLLIPFVYFRFKPLRQIVRLRSANEKFGYDKLSNII